MYSSCSFLTALDSSSSTQTSGPGRARPSALGRPRGRFSPISYDAGVTQRTSGYLENLEPLRMARPIDEEREKEDLFLVGSRPSGASFSTFVPSFFCPPSTTLGTRRETELTIRLLSFLNLSESSRNPFKSRLPKLKHLSSLGSSTVTLVQPFRTTSRIRKDSKRTRCWRRRWELGAV